MGKANGLPDDLRAKFVTGADLLNDTASDTQQLLANLNYALMQLGWSQPKFAEKLEVAPNTVDRWFRAEHVPSRPKLRSIAKAIGLDDPSLLTSPEFKTSWKPNQSQNEIASANTHQTSAKAYQQIDRTTNPKIAEIRDRWPTLFKSWTKEEWDELYSIHGTGGELSEDGVITEANLINRRREAIRKLNLLFDGKHAVADALAILIDALEESVRA